MSSFIISMKIMCLIMILNTLNITNDANHVLVAYVKIHMAITSVAKIPTMHQLIPD